MNSEEFDAQRERNSQSFAMLGFNLDLKYYLSGPMSGYENFNYPMFEYVAGVLRVSGMNVESPHENPPPPAMESMREEEIWQYYMNLCRLQLASCSGIILLQGWPQSRGARQELEWALAQDLPVWFWCQEGVGGKPAIINMNRELQ